MPTSLPTSTLSARAPLLAAPGNLDLETDLLDSGAFPPDRLGALKEQAAPEDWGEEDGALLRYLTLHVPLQIAQGRFVRSGSHLVLRAGQLATVEGTPLYLGLARAAENRFELAWADEKPSGLQPLLAADLGAWPTLDPRLEVVVAVDPLRSSLLAGLGRVAQEAAVAGAVEWSLRRGLGTRQLRGESRGYFVPVHLTSREAAPDLVAPIQVQSDRLLVRALIDPREAYAAARAVVERREQLPAWLLDAWAGQPAGT